MKVSVKRLRQDIHKFIQDDDYAAAIETLRVGMKATHTVRQKDPEQDRFFIYDEVPDHSVRLHSAKLMLEYGFGKPATRTDITVRDETSKSASPDEIMQRIRESSINFSEIAHTYVESLPEVEKPQELTTSEPELAEINGI